MKHMAYPAGLLVRPDGNIRYQYRIPNDLLKYYPKALMSENLGTKDKALAAQLIYARKAELEREYARLRAQSAQALAPRRSITEQDATNIAKAMLASSAQADEELRHEGQIDLITPPPELGPSVRTPDKEAVRLAAAKGDYSAFTDIVNEWLMGHGYDLEPGSPDFRKVAREFAQATQRKLEIQRRRDDGEFVESPAAPSLEESGTSSTQTPSGSTPTLGQVVKHFLDNYDSAAPMFKKHQAALGLLLESVGNVPVSQIRQLQIDAYFDMLSRLPPRWADKVRRKGVSVQELAKLEHEVTLSPKTFEYSYMASVRPFLAEAKRLFGDSGFPQNLTVEGIKYKGTQKAGARKQRAFQQDELKRLFEGCEYEVFAADPATAPEYWVPLIGLYTGARVNEICQLNPQCDIKQEDGIWFLDLTEESEADERVTKSVKTAGSKRKVPVHSQLLELGFLSYVESVSKLGATILFPKWVPTRGRASPAAEDWFREFLRETGLRDETHGQCILGMHAFRHTLLNYGFNHQVPNVEVITGHAGEASRVVRGYRGEMALSTKKAIIEQIRFDVQPPKPKNY
jgi:integrase